jgi:hypothetical protein
MLVPRGLPTVSLWLTLVSCSQIAGLEDGELAGSGGASGNGGSVSTGGAAGSGGTGGSAGTTGGAAGGGGTSTGGAAGGGGTAGSKPSYAEVVLSDGPSAYWRLGEGVTPTAFDATGNGHDGTYKDVVLSEPGAIAGDSDTAVRIKGTYTGGIDIGDVFGFEGHAPFTVELWVKPEDVDGCFVGKGEKPEGGAYAGWFMYYSAVNTTLRRSGLNMEAPPIEQGKWSHVVATHDGVNSAVYINGELGSQKTDSGTLPKLGALMRVGRMDDWKPFVGVLDEVAIYEKNLAPARIKAHYLAGIGQ